MKQITFIKLLRLAGMMAWLMYPVGIIAMIFNQPEIGSLPPPPGADSFAEDIVALVSLFVFGGCFWVNMRDIPVGTQSTQHYVLLALQLIAGLGVSMFVGDAGLMYVLAAEIPLILRRDQAIKWMGVQAIISLPWTWLIYETGHFNLVGELQTIPAPLLIGLTALTVITWQLFAFSVGWLAANEARDRRELARLNIELLAAKFALAEQSRVEERLHISRELHDVMGHHLIALNLQLELASRSAPDEKGASISAASSIARDLLSEARKIVSVLRKEPTGSLVHFLHSLRSGIPFPTIHLDVQSDWDAPKEVQHVFLRCIQEAVSNALRHSNASNIRIDLRQDSDAFFLAIKDDGVGFEKVPAGNGLTGMRERIERLAGEMVLTSQHGQGCLIEVRIQKKVEQ